MRFIADFPISELEPADYNPRQITTEAYEALKRSISRFGIIKPFILNGEKQIAAGHQRAKACVDLGLKNGPAVILEEVAQQDEIMFNLLHNRLETNSSVVYIKGAARLPCGFSLIRYHRIDIRENQSILVTNESARLINKYGSWGAVIIDEGGRVIDNADYAVAASQLRSDLLVCKVSFSDAEDLKQALERDYGRYDYDHLTIKAYNQHHCQMRRLTGANRANKSTLYENFILPDLTKDQRLFDFGAGRCAYVDLLKKQGFRALGYEPHFVGQGMEIDLAKVIEMIKAAEADIAKHGLYDVVVLDGVLNSITSLEFEKHVLSTCNALTAAHGSFYVGTRSLEHARARETRQKGTIGIRKRYLQFLDKDNFSVSYRYDTWTMQRFHSVDSLRDILIQYFDEVHVYDHKRSDIWAVCRGPKKLPDIPQKNALEVEFNMEYPSGRHDQHEAIVDILMRMVGIRNGSLVAYNP